MSEWDFLWDLKGEALEGAMTTGATKADWDYIERCEMQDRWLEKLEGYNAMKASGDARVSVLRKRKLALIEEAWQLDVSGYEIDGIEVEELWLQWAELVYQRSPCEITREEFLRRKRDIVSSHH